MLRVLHTAAACLMVALGALHISFTWHDYDSFTLGAMYFASAGIAIILAGFINLVLLRVVGADRLVQALCVITNLLFALLFGVAATMLPQSQVYFGFGLFTVTTVSANVLCLRSGARAVK